MNTVIYSTIYCGLCSLISFLWADTFLSGSLKLLFFLCQLMEATPSGLHIRSVVPHVVEVCSRGQELAQPLLQQMAAKTAAYMGQVLSHRNVAPYHVQVSVKLCSLIITL